MEPIRGAVLSCGRYGCVVRLMDGRFANLPSTDPGYGRVRSALAHARKPRFPFVVSEQDGWLLAQLALGDEPTAPELPAERAPQTQADADSSLDDKIIEYLRQTEDWDPNGAIASRAQEGKEAPRERLLPFEMRARRQYRESPKRPPRKKH
ncbi:MAG: hypothetical protein JO347_05640 [Candidatus Eremiobacteraeota bacterium]|nr:hypothetical protein [Candidatus Eremiobacteraeota bacterium]MBV8281532.1 hypothetical protein [Candidatus Eremiobacteraeota bacterium]